MHLYYLQYPMHCFRLSIFPFNIFLKYGSLEIPDFFIIRDMLYPCTFTPSFDESPDAAFVSPENTGINVEEGFAGSIIQTPGCASLQSLMKTLPSSATDKRIGLLEPPHDHNNDYLASLYGIALGYGRFSGGKTTYIDIQNGARIITLKEGERGFSTFIRLQDGSEICKTSFPGIFK